MLTLLLFIVLIFLEALYESLYDTGKKTLSGVIEFFHRAIFYLALMAWMIKYPFIWEIDLPFWKLLIGFLFIRYSIFSFIYNLFRFDVDIPLFYVGHTKIFDKVINWFLAKSKFNPSIFLGITKLACFILGADFLEIPYLSSTIVLILVITLVLITIITILIGTFRKITK